MFHGRLSFRLETLKISCRKCPNIKLLNFPENIYKNIMYAFKEKQTINLVTYTMFQVH